MKKFSEIFTKNNVFFLCLLCPFFLNAETLSGKTVLSVQKAGQGTPNKIYETNRPHLKFATYNIGKNQVSSDVKDLSKLISGIRKINADIITVTEIDNKTKRSGNIDQLKTIADKLKLYSVFGNVLNFDGGQYGVGILSKYPIKKSQLILLPSGRAEQRGVLLAEIAKPDFEYPILVMATHLDWQKDPTVRLGQVRSIMDIALGDAPSNFPDIASSIKILAGDFNSTPSEQPMQELKSMWTRVGENQNYDGRSFPSINPAIDIDHILTFNGQKWKTNQIKVLSDTNKEKWSDVSDHLPVVADLTLLEQ